MKVHHRKQHISRVKIILITASIPAILFITLLLLPQPTYKDGFKTLEQIETYAKQIPENVQTDTANTIKPEFNNYLKTLTPTWKSNIVEKLSWLGTFIHLSKPPIWSPTFFKEQIISITKERKSKNFDGDFVCKLKTLPQTKIVIFGTLQGAFHSLVRDLKRLKNLGIINNELKLGSANDFMIFNGDLVSRSPFSMQTLSLVLQLIRINPNQVIYIKGNHETSSYWQEHSLKAELQIRAARLSPETVPLGNEVNAFFGTLPLALYIPMNQTNTDFIRISDAPRGQNPLLNEQNYATFLTGPIQESFACINVKHLTPNETVQTPNIKVIFKGEKKRETYQPHDGVRLLPPDMDSTAWTILSCPTPVYQKAIKFVHDAFIILTASDKIDEWKLTLHHRNVTTQEDFSEKSFYLLSGLEPGKQKETAPLTTPQQTAQAIAQKTTPSQLQKSPPPSALQPIPPVAQPVQAPTPQPQVSVQQPVAIAPTDTTPTSTVAEHVEAIYKHTQAIEQEMKKLEKTLKVTPAAPQNNQPTPPTNANKSAFEPIDPTQKGQETQTPH